VQDQVDGLVGRRQADGAQYRLRIVDADAAGDRDAQDARALLAVNHGDDAGVAFLLEAAEQRSALAVLAAGTEQLQQ